MRTCFAGRPSRWQQPFAKHSLYGISECSENRETFFHWAFI